jgi:hypothetical protein
MDGYMYPSITSLVNVLTNTCFHFNVNTGITQSPCTQLNKQPLNLQAFSTILTGRWLQYGLPVCRLDPLQYCEDAFSNVSFKTPPKHSDISDPTLQVVYKKSLTNFPVIPQPTVYPAPSAKIYYCNSGEETIISECKTSHLAYHYCCCYSSSP